MSAPNAPRYLACEALTDSEAFRLAAEAQDVVDTIYAELKTMPMPTDDEAKSAFEAHFAEQMRLYNKERAEEEIARRVNKWRRKREGP